MTNRHPDIVERLRNDVCLLSRLDWQEHVALAREAADEIERLRRAAGECVEAPKSGSHHDPETGGNDG